MASNLLLRFSPITGKATFYWHRRVPSKLVPFIKKRFWRESLSTSDRTAAEREACRLNADAEAEIARANVERRRERELAARLTPSERDVVERAGGLQSLRQRTKTLHADMMINSAVAGMLRPTVGDAGDDDAPTDMDALELAVAEAEATAAALRRQYERNRGILAKGTMETAPEPAAAPAQTLDTVIDRWAKETVAPSQHEGQYRYPARLFTDHHGKLALKDIRKSHLLAFKDALARMPRSTRANIREASFARAIAIADREDLPRLEPRTVMKHMVAIGTLLRWANAWGMIETNPADGFRLPKRREKIAATSRRRPFTPTQLRALDASLASEYPDTCDDRWLPIVAAYQGGRLEEIAQLQKDDVRQVGDVWVVEITDAEEGQKVKNKASKRAVPLHPALIERGFLDHWKRSPGPRLFAQLEADKRGRYGGPYGKRFSRHLRKRTKIVDSDITFHSLRHTWKTAARNAGVPEAEQATIMGHQHGTPVADGYGDRHAVAVLLPWLAKVDPFADPGETKEASE